MSRKDDLNKLIHNHTRRLQKLEEQRALLGLSVDPTILIEIENIESKLYNLRSELEYIEKSPARIDNHKVDEQNSTTNNKPQEVFLFIKNFIKRKRIPPTRDEIREGLKISSKSVVARYLEILQNEGRLIIKPNTPRGICLVNEDEVYDTSVVDEVWVKVPLRWIAAGGPIQMPESIESIFEDASIFDDDIISVNYIKISIPRRWEKHKKRISALRVKGDSMVDASVNDGDTVVVYHPTIHDTFENGDMVAVWLIEQEETTLKYIYYENEKDRIRLQPANQKYEPIYVSSNNHEIQGRVIKIIRSSV